MDKFVLLLDQYCDNDLAMDDQIELENWLKKDLANVDRFTRATMLHSLLYDLIKEQNLQSRAWSHALKENEPSIPIAKSSLIARSRRNAAVMLVAGMLACVLTAIVVMPYVNKPALVAQITNLNGAVATANGQAVLAGNLLAEGDSLQLEEGSLLVTFQCGAKVLIDGPAEFVVDSASTGSLVRGKASARIPTQAIGFAIHTSIVDIIDLGTEFQIKTLPGNQLELHVFDGLVEVRLAKEFEHAKDAPLRISEGRSMRFDLNANEIATLDYDESLKQVF